MGGGLPEPGTLEELREQIIDVALDRPSWPNRCPATSAASRRRLEEGRARLNLIAQESPAWPPPCCSPCRRAAQAQGQQAAAEVADDIQAQLQRLVGKRFLLQTPWPALQQLPRYLKAWCCVWTSLRADPVRDAALAWPNCARLEQRWLRRVAELRGAGHARWTNSAGCWKNCASASSHRNCARRSR